MLQFFLELVDCVIVLSSLLFRTVLELLNLACFNFDQKTQFSLKFHYLGEVLGCCCFHPLFKLPLGGDLLGGVVFAQRCDLLLSLRQFRVKQLDLALIVGFKLLSLALVRSFKRLDLALEVTFKRLDLGLVFGLLLLTLVDLIFVSIGTVFSVLAGNLNSFSVVLCIETVNLVDVALLALGVEGVELVDRGDVLFVLVKQLGVFVLDLLLEAVVLFD